MKKPGNGQWSGSSSTLLASQVTAFPLEDNRGGFFFQDHTHTHTYLSFTHLKEQQAGETDRKQLRLLGDGDLDQTNWAEAARRSQLSSEIQSERGQRGDVLETLKRNIV